MDDTTQQTPANGVATYRTRPIKVQAIRAAWGTHGARNERGQRVARTLNEAGVGLWCLGVTKDGQPRHPLYLSRDTELVPYRVGVRCDA